MMRKFLSIFLGLSICLSAFSQNQEPVDSLVVLMSSKSAQLVDIEGASYRKVIGPARFLHNNTYLLCDTALWNVDARFIDAWGNVSILQEETVLTSDKLTYFIDNDLAQFRGTLVQLQDKDHNILRTRFLDYNTKDSVAVFNHGGAMRDKDGQIIESRSGTYDSKIKKFKFTHDVNMFTDSVFIKTADLVYESDLNLATFGRNTNAWKDDNMLAADAGWYDRGIELFFFTDKVHVMSEDQEAWCDSLFFNRNTNCVEMLGNVQVSDTTRNVFALAGRIEYEDALSRITLTREPAVITQAEEQDGSIDTVYLGAEKLVYYTVRKCDLDSAAVRDSRTRLQALEIDPVGEFRKKAAADAAKAAEEEAMNDPNQRAKKAAQGAKQNQAKQNQAKPQGAGPKPGTPPTPGGSKQLPKMQPKMANLPKAGAAPPDTSDVANIPVPSDSLARPMLADSLALKDSLAVRDSLAVADSLATPPDTTKVGFLEALKNVKIYKKNMQVVCDSLVYTDIDSLARLYIQPVVWQDSVRQYAADSITIVIRNNAMEKASLMSNAFITIQEDKLHFNQIRGAEMTAYFNDKGGLDRFDALGGASALFYIEENDELATVNKTDSKMLSAVFKNGNLQKIYYYDAPKNDAYPVVQLKEEERQMRGFSWTPERRPADREAVTELSLRPGERSRYSRVEQPKYKETEKYFPGYIGDVKRQIAVRDSLRKVRERERAISEKLKQQQMDTLAFADSVAKTDSLAVKDSIGTSKPVSDSLAVGDSTVVKKATAEVVLDKKALKEAKKAEREKAKLDRQKRKEERWAALDKRDEEKAKAKAEKKKEKERERKRKALKGMARQAEKDARTLQKYKEKYQNRKTKALK